MTDKTSIPFRSGRLLTFTVIFTLIGLIVWADWAELDQTSRAPGEVIASSRNQVIQAQDGGTVEEMLVKEGARVKEGQVLLRFDKEKVESAFLEIQARVIALKGSVARLKAESFGEKLIFPPELQDYPEVRNNQITLFKNRQAAVKDELAAFENSRQKVLAELGIYRSLEANGDVSRLEIIRLERQDIDLQGQIINRRNRYMQEAQTDLSRIQEDLDVALQVLAQRKNQLDRMVIVSPVEGIVRNVRITTKGGVARPGEEIMQILPVDEDLLIEAKVRTADIAFIKPGLQATIKLDAYDYSIYGSLHGVVTYISADSLSDEVRTAADKPYYRVQVKVTGKNFVGNSAQHIEVQPGMTATVEIKTGSNTVLKYLTKPITKTISESLNER